MTATDWKRRLFAPVDASSLAVFRVLFGALMLVAVARFFAHGWIREYYLVPKYFFTYDGFEWVRPWPGWGMYLHFALMGVAALGIALGGWAYRLGAPAFGVLFTYAHLIDKTNYLNHYYFISLVALLLVFLPLHRASFHTTVPAWMLWLLRGQVGCVYFFGGVAKLKPDWLMHAQPLKIWLAANSDLPVLGRWFEVPWVPHAFSIAGALFDLTVVPALLWRRSRPFAYAAALAFHGITGALFQIGMFPWVMVGCALLFFPPDWPKRLLRRSSPWQGAPEAPGAPRWVGPALAAVFLLVQIALPLRHWLTPGNVLWTEQGFRFSWNVMLMEKDGVARFWVREPSTGRAWRVNPKDLLTPYQAKMMASQPDMVRAFARHLRREFEAEGYGPVEVHADVTASLNGRPRQRLVDPAADLGREDVGPRQALSWVLPFDDTPPP